MDANRPYCYLYKNSPDAGDLYVSTVVELPANKDLNAATQSVQTGKTTVTYTLKTSLGLPEGIRTPSDEKIVWDGSERIVEVVVDSGPGTKNKKTEINTNSADPS